MLVSKPSSTISLKKIKIIEINNRFLFRENAKVILINKQIHSHFDKQIELSVSRYFLDSLDSINL